jgi:hypothetical protein
MQHGGNGIHLKSLLAAAGIAGATIVGAAWLGTPVQAQNAHGPSSSENISATNAADVKRDSVNKSQRTRFSAHTEACIFASPVQSSLD